MKTRFLNPKIHGFLDYALVAALFAAPTIFGFAGTNAAGLAYVLGIVQLVMSLATAYPLGLVRWIPFPVHGVLELMAGIGMLAAPWLLGFAILEPARNFYVAAGIGVVALWTVTNYRSTLSNQARIKETYTEDYRRAA